jgi:diguanylate cyclase (GGDEF)-like protein/excisionase family DNA binding protein
VRFASLLAGTPALAPAARLEAVATSLSPTGTVTVTGAARILGVHVNTIRSWTDQGRLPCMRINSRGDRRYSIEELQRFLADAGSAASTDENRPIELLASLAQLCAEDVGPPELAHRAARLLATRLGYTGAIVFDDTGKAVRVAGEPAVDERLVASARRTSDPLYGPVVSGRRAIALAIDEEGRRVLQLTRNEPGRMGRRAETALLRAVGVQLTGAAAFDRQRRGGEEDSRRAALLHDISRQITAQNDLGGVLRRLLDSAMEVFGADHGGVFSRRPDGRLRTDVQRNIGEALTAAIERAPSLPLVALAHETRRMVSVANFPLDPRSRPTREALLAEGVNTVSVAPLTHDDEMLGTLILYHDEPYEWRPRDRTLFEQLAAQGAAALRTARLLSRSEAWAAQLQSIQQLGVLLNRLDDPREIGRVIAYELDRLIDYHNVRVYRVAGDDVVPLAWRGTIGAYADEDVDQLGLKVGEGITGWVAQHGLSVNLADAANDPRSQPIPGTEADLDESMLVAPMLHEDTVIGVLVLSKLGLSQFADDDLRLLEIFAAIAGQAIISADAAAQLRRQSERLARQVASQRELLRITESILSTLDRQALLDEIADRLTSLIAVDNICVELYNHVAGTLEPIFARGRHADHFMATSANHNRGISGYVARTAEPALVADQLADPRLLHFEDVGPLPGSLIALPLRAQDQVLGVLTIERLGDDAVFSEDEYELAKLFGGHVSIALRNADVHHQAEVRAQTDALTGLLNHGALIGRLIEATTNRLPYALLMMDLDDFKGYNDRFGHQAGDGLLQALAEALRSACRESDEIYRYGGDEFAILLPHTSADGGFRVAQKIRAAVAESSRASRAGNALTCSVGVAAHPADGNTGEEVLLAADRACYVAKRTGRDRIATAADGLELAGEFQPPPPTPVDVPEAAYPAA